MQACLNWSFKESLQNKKNPPKKFIFLRKIFLLLFLFPLSYKIFEKKAVKQINKKKTLA